MPWMQMTCGKCGHQADIDEFCTTPIGGRLPRDTYQCPACSHAVRRQTTGRGVLYESGLYVPGPVEIVVVDSRL